MSHPLREFRRSWRCQKCRRTTSGAHDPERAELWRCRRSSTLTRLWMHLLWRDLRTSPSGRRLFPGRENFPWRPSLLTRRQTQNTVSSKGGSASSKWTKRSQRGRKQPEVEKNARPPSKSRANETTFRIEKKCFIAKNTARVQFSDGEVNMPVVTPRQVPMIPNVQWRCRRSSASQDCGCTLRMFPHGLFQGEENETRERHAAGEDPDLLPVAPNMEAGGSHLQATAEEERRPARDPPNGRVPGASGKEARREGGCGGEEACAAGEGTFPARR